MSGNLWCGDIMNNFLFQGGMRAGVLTAKGRDQAYIAGVNLRQKYMDRYQILSRNFKRHEIVWVQINIVCYIKISTFMYFIDWVDFELDLCHLYFNCQSQQVMIWVGLPINVCYEDSLGRALSSEV